MKHLPDAQWLPGFEPKQQVAPPRAPLQAKTEPAEVSPPLDLKPSPFSGICRQTRHILINRPDMLDELRQFLPVEVSRKQELIGDLQAIGVGQCDAEELACDLLMIEAVRNVPSRPELRT
jgi:hypothetical protein